LREYWRVSYPLLLLFCFGSCTVYFGIYAAVSWVAYADD
jgi:hypothetical protein